MPRIVTQKDILQTFKRAHGDRYDYSKVVYRGVRHKVTIICPVHGEFLQNPVNHGKGVGCSQCNGGVKTWDTESFIKRSKELHGDKYDYSKVEYVNWSTKVRIKCHLHGWFEQIPHSHLIGYGCFKCGALKRSKEQTYSWSDFVERAREVHGTAYKYRRTDYTSLRSQIDILCKKHGVFTQRCSDHLNGNGCTACGIEKRSEQRRISLNQYIQQARRVYGHKYTYHKLVVEGDKRKIEFSCQKHGRVKQYATQHLSLRYGCPSCGRESQAEKRRLPWSEFLSRANAIHHDGFGYTKAQEDYKNSQSTLRVRCPKHGYFEVTASSFLRGGSCPECYPVTHMVSNAERQLVSYLRTLGDLEIQTSVRGMLPKNQELDIYLPEKKVAIEVNGIYWHTENFGKDASYHINKTRRCQKAGIRLLHFWDSEVQEHPELVQSMIAQRLGFTNQLYARKLVIEEIDKKIAAEFLNEHHLQGSSACKVAFALKTKKGNRIAAVMTFGVPYINKKYEWEIKRFATHKGLSVVGGASRLWSAFVKKVNPQSVITYANLRYATGDVYTQLGFKFLRNTKPNYMWVGPYYMYTRYQTQKHKLADLLGDDFDPNLSEAENMTNANYAKLYDCGNAVFEYRPT